MDDRVVFRVEIHRDDGDVQPCPGPDPAGACTRAVPGGLVPCGGCDLHLTAAPDDLWVFTVSPAARACPLAWLVASRRADSVPGVLDVRNRSVWKA